MGNCQSFDSVDLIMQKPAQGRLSYIGGVKFLIHHVHKNFLPELVRLDIANNQDITLLDTMVQKQSSLLSTNKSHSM